MLLAVVLIHPAGEWPRRARLCRSCLPEWPAAERRAERLHIKHRAPYSLSGDTYATPTGALFAVLLRRCHSFVSLERSALISFDETRLAVRWLFEMMSDRDELYFKAEAKERFDWKQ